MYMTMTILIFTFGLIVGSFLNAVIWRIKHKKSFLKGRSICPQCKHELGVLDLIPVFSFLFLRAKCRYCKKKINWQYPLVELATGLGFVLVETCHGMSLQTFFYIIIFCFLIIIFVYDLKYGLILDRVSIPAMVIAFAGNLIIGQEVWWSLILGAAIGGGIFLAQFLISKGKWVGGGDLRLGVVMGLLLGWEKVLVALFLAYISGALVAVVLLLQKSKKMKDAIVFGTFLSAATFVTMLYGDKIIDWYLGFIL